MVRKKILITGAAGFIGRKLARHLLDAGAEVHGTSRADRTGDNLPIVWHQGSFENLETAQHIVATVRPDIIFHLAGMVTGSNSLTNVLPTYHSLVTSTVNLLSVAATIDCERIIIVGSSNEPIGQFANSPYAAAKWTSSMYSRMYQQLYNLPIVIARAFVVYGPGQPGDKLIPYVVSQLAKSQRPKLSSGSWKTDWVYIDDVVEGLMQCATVPGVEGCTIDIGTGEYASVREVVEKLVSIVRPIVTPVFGALPDRHSEHTPVANTAYTWEKLHWKATTSLDEGLRRTVSLLINTEKENSTLALSE